MNRTVLTLAGTALAIGTALSGAAVASASQAAPAQTALHCRHHNGVTFCPNLPVRDVPQPAWLFIEHASRAQRRETCGYWPHTHTLIPGVLVTSGDGATLFCKNGKSYAS